jgi:hypothetical protein
MKRTSKDFTNNEAFTSQNDKSTATKKAKSYTPSVIEQNYPQRFAAYQKSINKKHQENSDDDSAYNSDINDAELVAFDQDVDSLTELLPHSMQLNAHSSSNSLMNMEVENARNFNILPGQNIRPNYQQNHSALSHEFEAINNMGDHSADFSASQSS